jgi:hypothetical protein
MLKKELRLFAIPFVTPVCPLRLLTQTQWRRPALSNSKLLPSGLRFWICVKLSNQAGLFRAHLEYENDSCVLAHLL